METIMIAASMVAALGLMLAVAWKWNILLPRVAVGSLLVVMLTGFLFYQFVPPPGGWFGQLVISGGQVGVTFLLGLSIVLFIFWQDPDRTPPEREGVVLSAADGEVIYIRTVEKGKTPLVSKAGRDYRLEELMGTRLPDMNTTVIGIEMNILNVHVNRSPIYGTVKLLKHIHGKFMSLRLEESPFLNERYTTVFENDHISVAVVQVASRLVRRIVGYLSDGQQVEIGQRMGMIRFGSLVAVVLPLRTDVVIEANVGDLVQAGRSVLARYGG